MSADLHIHILQPPLTSDDVARFSANTMGSKHFSFGGFHRPGEFEKLFGLVGDSPNIWIGEVSWLKAGLTEDPETFIPSTVDQIQETIGEDLPILDDNLVNKILKSFEVENTTSYSLANREDVEKFLIEHLGKQVFTVSW